MGRGGKGNGRDRRMVGVWVYKDKGGKGLAGAEGALLPSTDRTGRCPCDDWWAFWRTGFLEDVNW